MALERLDRHGDVESFSPQSVQHRNAPAEGSLFVNVSGAGISYCPSHRQAKRRRDALRYDSAASRTGLEYELQTVSRWP